jgi:hypothetical protein
MGFIEDLKEVNSKIKLMEKTIGHELILITELEQARVKLEKTKSTDIREILNRLEENKRRVRDLEYEEQSFQKKRKDIETQYRQERIVRLEETVKTIIDKRDQINNELVPRLEEKITGLKNRVVAMDTEILRLKGKIQFLSEK